MIRTGSVTSRCKLVDEEDAGPDGEGATSRSGGVAQPTPEQLAAFFKTGLVDVNFALPKSEKLRG